MTLCNIEDIYTYLRATDSNPSVLSTDEKLYEFLINAISDKIKKICDRDLEAATYTEYYDGKGTNYLLLKQWPISQVSSIYSRSVGSGGETLIDSSYYDINYDNGEIYYVGNFSTGLFSQGSRNYKVSYTAGYTDIPDDLKLICVKAVVNEFNKSKKDGNFKAEKLGDYSYTVSNIDADLKNEIQLAGYIRLA